MVTLIIPNYLVYSDFRYSLGRKSDHSVGQRPASPFCLSFIWLIDLLFGKETWFLLSSDALLPLPALLSVTGGCRPQGHFPSSLISCLLGLTQAEAWKSRPGGRNRPGHFFSVSFLWFLCKRLNLCCGSNS